MSCQYNNIYIYIYIYIRKKNTNERLKKEKKKTVATGPLGTVATVQNFKKKKKKKVAHQNGTVDEQCKNTEWIVLKH